MIVKCRPSSVSGFPTICGSAPGAPQRARDDGTLVVVEPPPDDRVDAQVPGKFGRHFSADHMLRLSRKRHVEAGWPEPTERVEALRPLLKLLKIRERVRRSLSWFAEPRAVERDEAMSVGGTAAAAA